MATKALALKRAEDERRRGLQELEKSQSSRRYSFFLAPSQVAASSGFASFLLYARGVSDAVRATNKRRVAPFDDDDEEEDTRRHEEEEEYDENKKMPRDYYSNPIYWPLGRWLGPYMVLAYLFQCLVNSGELVHVFPNNGANFLSYYVGVEGNVLYVYNVGTGAFMNKYEDLNFRKIASQISIPTQQLKKTVNRAAAMTESFNNFITLAVILACILVGVQTYPGMDDDGFINFLDYAVLVAFSFEMAAKIIAEGFRPWMYFTGPQWKWNCFDATIIILSYPIPAVQDFFGGNSVTLLRLVRLARLGKLVNRIPPLKMVIQGLLAGISSIRYVVLLLILVFFIFGIIGWELFSENDPFHFGSLPKAMFTLYRISCLDNWSDIMYLNMYGCDYFPESTYHSPPNYNATTGQDDGKNTGIDAMLWCTNPQPNYAAGSMFFVAFVVVTAFVMLSLFIGAVTVAMVDNVEELKKMVAERRSNEAKKKNEHRSRLMKKMAKAHRKGPVGKQKKSAGVNDIERKRLKVQAALSAASGGADGNDGKTDGAAAENDDDDDDDDDDEDDDDDDDDDDDEHDVKTVAEYHELIRKYPLLAPYYAFKILITRGREQEAARIREEIAYNLRLALGRVDELKTESLKVRYKPGGEQKKSQWEQLLDSYLSLGKLIDRFILRTTVWNNSMTATIIVASALVGMQTDWRFMRYPYNVAAASIVEDLVLITFTLEIGLKIVALGDKPLAFFNDYWNWFDVIIVAGSWVPGTGQTLTMLRLLRLLRVLKLVRRLPQLGVIINALINGASAVSYIGLVLLLFLYVYSIIGMLLFAESDPWHFGQLHLAFMTLFKGISLDGWGYDSYVLIWGCAAYPGVYDNFPDLCTRPKAHGVLGGGYYLILILIGSQVLLSLFIGVISTSLEDSLEEAAAARELELRLAATAKKFLLTADRIEAFSVVFRHLDLDHGGTIDLEELKEGLECIGAEMEDEAIMKILIQIDPEGEGLDVNGFINFVTKTPLFSLGTNQAANMRRAIDTFEKSKLVGRKKVALGQWRGEKQKLTPASFVAWLRSWSCKDVSRLFHPITDPFTGGKAAREYRETMYAALLIQDMYREKVQKRIAQTEAKKIMDFELKKRLNQRLALQRGLEESTKFVRMASNYSFSLSDLQDDGDDEDIEDDGPPAPFGSLVRK